MTYPTRDQIVDDGVRDVTSMNLRKTIVINVARGIHTTNLFLFSSWKDLLLTGFFSRNPTTRMSSTATNDVKTTVPIFDGSNYNV